jgi:hypothetical protein
MRGTHPFYDKTPRRKSLWHNFTKATAGRAIKFMSWIKASDVRPPEDEQILIHDNQNSRIELGRYIKGRWYVENIETGRLSEIAGVTHWSWILDSEINDDED